MKRALLVIDVQNEYFTGLLPVTYPVDSLSNILAVMKHAVEIDLPVILIQHISPKNSGLPFAEDTFGCEIHQKVLDIGCGVVIEKELPGSFTGTHLKEFLDENDVDTLVITGYMTQMCCDTTARQALHLGYGVEFLSDATGTLDISNDAGSVTAEELHKAILVTQQMRFSKVLSTQKWIAETTE